MRTEEATMADAKETATNDMPADEVPASPVDEEKQTEKPSSEWTLVSNLTLLGCFLSMFCSVGFVNAFGVFQEYYHSTILKSYSNFDINWIISFTSFVMYVGALPSGYLIDTFGARAVIGSGSIGIILGIFMTSLCHEYWQFFLAQAVLIGASLSLCTIPCIAVISRRFQRHRGIATGLAVAGSSAGGVVWPIVVNELLHKDHVSFGWTMRIVGFVMMPALATAVAFIQDQKTPPEAKTATSEDQPQQKKKKKPDLSILKNPTFLFLMVGYAIYSLAMFTPFFFVTSYAVSLGMGASFAFYLLSIMNAASLVGRISMGFLADVYGPFNLASIAALLSSVVCFCWTTAKGTGGIVVWSLAYGFTSGSLLSLMPQCASKLATHATYGTAMGAAMGLSSIAALVGSPIAGELVSDGWLAVSMYCGAALMAGTVLIFLARLRRNRSLLAKA